MSERPTPHSHSRAKSSTNKNGFLSSGKQDVSKTQTSSTAATDSQAVVIFNRQQRYNQNNNNTNYNSSYAKGDKSEQQYNSPPQKPAYHKSKSISGQGQGKLAKHNSYSAVSSKPQASSVPGNRTLSSSKTSPIPPASASPEPIPPPPVNTDTKAPVLQGAWANPPKVRSASSPKFEHNRKSLSPGASHSPVISTDQPNAAKLSPKYLSRENLDSVNNAKAGVGESSVNLGNYRKSSAKKMPAPTNSGPRSGPSAGVGGSQVLGDRTAGAQDRNSPTGTNNSSSSHATRSGSNSVNGPTSVVSSPSGSSVSVNGLERCPIGSTVKCTTHHATATTPNGLNGPSSGGASTTHPANPRQRNVFEGEVLAFDPRIKVLVLKCSSESGKTSVHDVHIINLSLPHEIKVLADKKEAAPDPSSLNINRLQNRLRDQVERKKKQVMAFKAGISPMGQKLFQAISKTIDDVSWNGDKIYVLKEVTIYPPYRPEDVKGNMDSKALKHVRKIVEKHLNDQSMASSPLPGQSPGASPSFPASSNPTQTARGSISTGGSSTPNAAAARATSPPTTQQSSSHGVSSPNNSRDNQKSSSSSATSTLPNQPSNKNNSREGSKRGSSSANSPTTHAASSGSASDRSQAGGGGSGPPSARNMSNSHYQPMKSSSYNQ